MLWQIGAIILVIDIFYRVSVPIDQLFQVTSQEGKHNSTNGVHPKDGGVPNAIIIDDKGVAMLLDRLSLATPEKQKLWLQSLRKALAPGPTTVRPLSKKTTTKGRKPALTTHKDDNDVKMSDVEEMAQMFTMVTETEAPHTTKKPEPNVKQTVFKDKDGTQSLSEGIYHGNEVGADGGKDSNVQ